MVVEEGDDAVAGVGGVRLVVAATDELAHDDEKCALVAVEERVAGVGILLDVVFDTYGLERRFEAVCGSPECAVLRTEAGDDRTRALEDLRRRPWEPGRSSRSTAAKP